MNKVIIEVTVNDIHEYRNEPWFEYVLNNFNRNGRRIAKGK